MDGEDTHVQAKGHLDVGNGHSLYWEDWGNPDAEVILYLHGGPGSGFDDSKKLLYDPEKQRVIFYDQRGSGRSIPFAETSHNTTQDLISDIEKLLNYRKVEKVTVMGGSWGSTLALLYAIAHPERVNRILIWSLFLARQIDLDYVNEGYAKYLLPEAWERFISQVPTEQRHNGTATMRYYDEQMHSPDETIAKKYSNEWTLWEASLLSINYDPLTTFQKVFEDQDNKAHAMIETHYFLNNCFIEPNYVLNNVIKIKHIPCNLVHGRFDLCTAPVGALELSKAYGENLTLEWINSGHTLRDTEMFAAVKRIGQ